MQKIYRIDRNQREKNGIKSLLENNRNIKFLSIRAVDPYGRQIDQRIPIRRAIEDGIEDISIEMNGYSMALKGNVKKEDSQVYIVPDMDVDWFVDYVDRHDDVGSATLVIPGFLMYKGKLVCSRSILKRAEESFKKRVKNILSSNPSNRTVETEIIDLDEITISTATELEFWVSNESFNSSLPIEINSNFKEKQWGLIEGKYRLALEKVIETMEDYGLYPEMCQIEAGGIVTQATHAERKEIKAIKNVYGSVVDYISDSVNKINRGKEEPDDSERDFERTVLSDDKFKIEHLYQLEVSWRYDTPLKCADNEIVVKEIIKRVFKGYGMKVHFAPKPFQGLSGNGGHVHMSVGATLKNGKYKNLFVPRDTSTHHLSLLGYSSLMGILKNYEVIKPIAANTEESLSRLVPNFQAPVSIVASLGKGFEDTSRNRSSLITLIKDLKTGKGTRIELRSPDPTSNKYTVIAAMLQASIDGIENVHSLGMDIDSAYKELTKKAGERGEYLETERLYIEEENIYDKYTEGEREALFGKAGANLEEVLEGFDDNSRIEVLKQDNVFTDGTIDSIRIASLEKYEDSKKFSKYV